MPSVFAGWQKGRNTADLKGGILSATCTSDDHQFNFLLLFLGMAKNFALPFIQFASFDLVEISVVETSPSIFREQSIIFPYISI